MKRRLLYAFIAIFLLPIDILAAPSDYWRLFNSSRFSVIIGQIILLIIICVVLYVCINHFFGKTYNKSTTNNISNLGNGVTRGHSSNDVCPYCHGKLFIDLGRLSPSRKELEGIDPGELEFYWGNGVHSPVECARRICPHCKGRGTI